MRYIDADALMDNIEKYCGDYFCHDEESFDKGSVRIAVKGAPTADVAPVVHGAWILVCANAHHYDISVEEKCSVCGRYVYRYDTQPQDNFCPSCGARMDGGDT